MRALILRVLLLLVSLAIFVATGEIALRVIYRDAGRNTLGGPGGRGFLHDFIRDDLRGRLEYGAKRPGVPRIMVLGDSITWGQGVRDWRNIWTERLAVALERAGTPHEMAVLAQPGRGIVTHVREFDSWVADIQPDVVIYQWYVNDVEVVEHRPQNVRWWHRLGWHRTLQQSSYLYFFLDDRLSKLLPQPDRSYVQYILEDFGPGTLEWSEYERYFHALAARMREAASARVLIVYPQVPFRGPYPLQPVHDRLREMAGPRRLSIPPVVWIRWAGTNGNRPDARWKQTIEVPAGHAGAVLETRDYYFPAGSTELSLGVLVEGGGAAGGGVEVIDEASGATLTTVQWRAQGHGWQQAPLQVTLPGPRGRQARLRVGVNAGPAVAFGSLEIATDYGLKVVDLTETLNTFDTHASIFDAHPNERAHGVIAEKVLEALRPGPSGKP